MKTNKTSQWAGYSASFFSIIYFITGILIGITESATSRPRFLYVAMGLSMSLAALSGVVCLASAVLGFLKEQKTSN
jgi:hypothetical protein